MRTSTLHHVSRTGLVTSVLVFLASPTPVFAQGKCFTGLADCFQMAATIQSFWYRTWTALDCEVELIACVRIAVFGL